MNFTDPREARKQAKKKFLSRSYKEVLKEDRANCEKFSMGLSLICPKSIKLRSDVNKHLDHLEKENDDREEVMNPVNNSHRYWLARRKFNNERYQQWLAKKNSKKMLKLMSRVTAEYRTVKKEDLNSTKVTIRRCSMMV